MTLFPPSGAPARNARPQSRGPRRQEHLTVWPGNSGCRGQVGLHTPGYQWFFHVHYVDINVL